MVRVLTLNRPEVLNAIDAKLSSALREAFVAADAEPGVRCIPLTAAGERAFCSGADLKQLAAATHDAARGTEARVIDLVVAAEHATFALPEVRRGGVAVRGELIQTVACGARRRPEPPSSRRH
jgi:enoyl-CoA hydratase/carnithine racemase